MPFNTVGDANNDEMVDIMDFVNIIDYIVGAVPCISMNNANANNDQAVDILDLVWIIDYIISQQGQQLT